MLEELVTGRRATSGGALMTKVYVCTDCRSLYDSVRKIQPAVAERRAMIDILSIRESIRDGCLRWLPTGEMLADCLTKVDRVLMARFAIQMGDTRVSLREAHASS